MNSPTKAPSLTLSVISCKCPRCRRGDIFPNSTFSLKFHKTNDYCPVCNLKYEHETGFFWGAMYISYAFNTAIMIAVGIVAINYNVVFRDIILILIPFIVLITPFSYRYSRVLLLYLLSPYRKYDPDYKRFKN
jgi:uncharacterized protein (DUF983 family)